MGRRLWLFLLIVGLAPGAAVAQDFRGAITGRIADKSGAVLPGVTVTATNVATNVGSTTTTNSDGVYSILYLTPGQYTVVAELSGFKKLQRPGIEVRVGDRLTLDLSLEIGAIEETVMVTAQSPLLEMASGSAGQVIDEKRIALMPLSDGNPFVLTRLVPGVAYTGDLKFSRPFDNAGTSSINADGSTGGNEFTLDGSPNMASGRRVAFVPPAGAVAEFKVQTATFDAADGHTAGAIVNVTLKSGTNRLKGEVYEYLRRDALEATDFFLLKAGLPKPKVKYDRPGGSVGGPVRIPGLYNGKDRTFFFGAIEWLYDQFPEPGPRTVPSAAMRNGDFSELLAQNIVIYDPATAQQVGARVVRTPFPGNIIPTNRISPIAQQLLKYYPMPNQPGDLGRNNYFSSNPRSDTFYSISTRFDHQLSNKQHVFARYTRNNRRESRGAYFGTVNDVVPTGNFLFRINDGVTYDHVYTMSSSSVLDVRAGWQRFKEPNVRQHEGLVDPASLGFPANVVALFNGAKYFPVVDVGGMSQLGDNLAGNTEHSIYSFQPTLTRIAGNHSVRAGYDLRLYKEFGANANRLGGEYQFRSNFTRAQDNSTGLFGQDVAGFLLGLPSGGSIDRTAQRLNYTLFNGVFVQDDWKVSNRLTVNLGLRYELEGATTESQNRNVRGFDPNASIGIAATAKAAYAANPIPQVPVSAFNPRGGLQFASDSNPGFWNADKNNFQPRVGFAYQLNEKTVLRGGVGVYAVPFIISGVLQPGFSQNTALVASDDLGLTFRATLANPYPSGVLQPAGASRGADTFLGQTAGRFAPIDFKNGQNARYTIGVQRELPGQWLLDVGFTGSRGWNQTTDLDLNPIPVQYLSTSRVRDQANIDFLNASVANPFAGLLPGTTITGATVARSQLLRPFPQFTGVTTSATDGTTRYKSLQTKLERRFLKGYTLLVGYTWSKFTESTTKLNATDTQYETRPSSSDVPHRISISGIWELPFGHGRRFGAGANRFADGFIGGWSVQAIGQWQSGRPIDFGNVYYNGDPTTLKVHYASNTDVPVFDTSGFYFHDAAVQTNGVDDPVKQRADTRIQLSNNVRYFPSRIDGIRTPELKEWALSLVKQVGLAGRVRAQFNLEVLNAFNQVFFNDANTGPTSVNFGKVTSQNNLPREVQLAMKLVF
jgi:Carboxypeptidase regulatory-like domain/TonB dependent receptor-like, beta-barrel